ncbi:EAL domain-containing protein [filamentous cyanobacterium LEGE 11480]|uniref:EAL domain-containing protein n=1 Tax=Romeriopsis navalis LEGE 11480 TaxID=2777977 RepID=A0A928Z581_9CYAN|nr:EAL domain-containing protein [Romeriopsis navalis]MBE9032539.1 EAL domain-containing protein [Romeriopsis navalis LEGE 11480]
MRSTAPSSFYDIFGQLITTGFAAVAESEIYAAVAKYLPFLMPVDRLAIAQIDATGATFELLDLLGGQNDLSSSYHYPTETPTLIKHCTETRQSLRLSVHADSPYEDVVELSQIGMRQVLVVPLHSPEQLLGSLYVATRQNDGYGQSELSLLEQIAALIVSNIERLAIEAQTQITLDRHRRYAERLEVLNETGRRLSTTTNEESAFHIVAETIEHVLESDRVSYVIPNPDGLSCQIFALTGNDIIPKAHQFPLPGSGIAAVLEQARPIAFPDLTDSTYQEHAILAAQGLRMGWSVPIHVGGKIVGILNAATAISWPFPDDALTLLSALGRFMSTTIERIQAQHNVAVTLRQLEYRVTHDQLTNLPNRRWFDRTLDQEIQQHRQYQRRLAVLFIDLDQFKEINDSLGHSIGDQLLCTVADRLREQLATQGVVARLGGDEFVVLLQDIPNLESVLTLSQRLLDFLQAPFYVSHHHVQIGGSIGISLFPDHGQTADELMKHADIAMYAAKAESRQKFKLYAPAMSEQLQLRLELERELQQAIANDELFLMFQPQIELQSGRIYAIEALVRWMHPQRGLIPPNVFIPIAETSQLISDISGWVLEASLQTLAALRRKYPDLYVSVNISAPDLLTPDRLHQQIQRLLHQYNLPGNALELELTESIFIEHPARVSATLESWQQQGIRLAIDDFGTGFSSLSYLLDLPLDTLKIDRTFVKNVHTNGRTKGIVETILSLSKNLAVTCVAEGVEELAQLNCLSELGCYAVQGFFLASPMVEHQLMEFLAEYDADSIAHHSISQPLS